MLASVLGGGTRPSIAGFTDVFVIFSGGGAPGGNIVSPAEEAEGAAEEPRDVLNGGSPSFLQSWLH